MKTPEEILSHYGLEPNPIDDCILIDYNGMVQLMHEYADQFKPKPQPDELKRKLDNDL